VCVIVALLDSASEFGRRERERDQRSTEGQDVFSARSLALTPDTLGLKRLRSKKKKGKGGLRPAEEARRMSARSLALSSCTLAPSRLVKEEAHQWHTEKRNGKGV